VSTVLATARPSRCCVAFLTIVVSVSVFGIYIQAIQIVGEFGTVAPAEVIRDWQ